MKETFGIILVLVLICQGCTSSADQLKNIQNANPLNVDLSDPSELDPELNEQSLGGYRPLYPPYFGRERPGPLQPRPEDPEQRRYEDREYYTRGAGSLGLLDGSAAPPSPPPDRELGVRAVVLAPPPAVAAATERQIRREAQQAPGQARQLFQRLRAAGGAFAQAASYRVKSVYSFGA